MQVELYSVLDAIDESYRTCVWCYRTLGGRRIGRYCCGTCKLDAAAADRCEYCGEPAQARDHVVPRAYRKAMEGSHELHALLVRMPDTVPTCHQCNSIAGAKVYSSLDEKRAAIQERLTTRYWRLLAMPAWDDDELDELTGRMKESIAASEAARRIMQTRISWPGNPRG